MSNEKSKVYTFPGNGLKIDLSEIFAIGHPVPDQYGSLTCNVYSKHNPNPIVIELVHWSATKDERQQSRDRYNTFRDRWEEYANS